MANGKIDLGKKRLLSSTALTKHAAVFGALGLVFGASSASALDPNALPTDPNVVGGAATFNQSGATLNVNQSSNRTVIDWRSFDIGSNATTNFIQPGASSIAVNRVNSSANPTQIQGSLNANGQVWILNPNGVMFGKTAKVDVAGIVASTGNIDSAAFMRGDNRLQFTGVDGGEVSNAGLISVADGGLAAFVAPSVRNSGIIRARVGKVTLAAGTTYTLDLAGDRLVELGLGADNALVDQSGQVLADGSVVTITAKAATAVVDSIVNVSGTVMASGVHEAGGKIILTADNVTTTGSAVLAADGGTNGDGGTIYGYADKTGTYDGTFSAKGGANSGDGGSIETSGKSVDIQSGLRVDATAANGATGSWTIDPDDLTIDGGNVGAFEAGLDTANVNLLADNSITLDTDFNTSGQANSNTLNFQDEGADNNLTINLNGKITLAASQSLTGDGTSVNVGSAGSIQNGVDVAATGADVNVAVGTYAGNVYIDKGLTLAGAGMDETYLTGGIDLSTAAISDLMFYDFTVSGASDDAVVKSGKVTNFTMDGVRIDGENVAAQHGFASGKFYGDIAITNSEFVNIRGWSSFDNSTGSSPTDLTSVNFSNNLLDNTVGHITFRGAPADAPVTIANNTVRNVGDTTYLSGGIFKVFGADTVDFVNNTISGIGAIAGKIQNGIHDGAALIVRDVATLNVTGNTFTDNQEAILVDNGKTLPTTTNFADNTFTNNAYDINFGNGVGAAEVNFSAGNTFTSGAQSQQFLIMGSSSDVDMTNVQFDGKLGSAMTNAELFALEDHITHGLDNAATGLVTVKADNVYVTENSGSIQRGVDKVTAGDTVNVDAGTFDDALNITKNVDIIGAGAGQTFLMPTSLLATGVTHKYTSDMQATIFVNGADDVNISGITIDGNGLSNDALVFWNNSSGSISDAVLRNVRPFSGAQTGQGIAVDGSGGTVDLTLTNVTIQDYNKNAIDVINGNGATTGGSDITLQVNDSTFTGRGITDTIAQNGVVLWERGGGTLNASIDGSNFSDLGYNGGADTAAGVLVYGSPNGSTTVSNSTFVNVQNYIGTAGGATNDIDATSGNTFDGVAVSTATLGQIYNIVDKIEDGLTSAGNGIVRLVANSLFLTEANGDIANAVNVADTGDTVNMQAGSFALGSSQLNINKSLTLTGAGEGVTNISSTSAGYGISVSGNDVTLSGFTFNASGIVNNSAYGIKVSPGGVATNRLTGFAIDNVTVDGSYKTGLDLNGVDGATIDHVTVTNTAWGNGISLTDSANIHVSNVTTSDNEWGGLAIYQRNKQYDQQVNNITIDGVNSFGEANPVYMEDESDGTYLYGGVNGLDIGAVNIAGFTLAGHNVNAADKYTWLNNTVTGLADWMLTKGELATGYVTGWTGSAANNEFYVGHATDTTAMSVNAAVDNAASGAVINVAGGNYAQGSQVNIDKDMTIVGDSGAKAVFTPGANFTGTSAASAWFLVDPDVNFGVSNVVFDGSGWQVVQALRSQGNTTVNNVDFRNIASSGYMGFAIEQFGGTVAGGLGSDTNGLGGSDGHLIVTNSTFTNIGRVGIEVKGDGSTADITGNTFTGKGAGDFLDYAVEVGAGGQADIIANTITNNLGVASSDGSTSAGVLVTSYYGGASTAILQNNFINGNTAAVALGYNNADVSVVRASDNDLSGNEHGVNSTSSSAVADFEYNWWGFTDQSAVDAYMGGDAAASVDSTPFLKSGTDTSPGTAGFQGNFAQTSENVNPAQIVVEGFTLPEGAIVTSSGGIILPRGMLIGLVSPAAGEGAAGGKPKVTIVHSVQMLGELLAEGYVAIVVDLEGTVDDEEEIALN